MEVSSPWMANFPVLVLKQLSLAVTGMQSADGIGPLFVFGFEIGLVRRRSLCRSLLAFFRLHVKGFDDNTHSS